MTHPASNIGLLDYRRDIETAASNPFSDIIWMTRVWHFTGKTAALPDRSRWLKNRFHFQNRLEKKEKQEHTTQEWLDAVADGSIDRKQKGRKPRDLDEIFEKTQSINEQTAGEAEEQTAGQPLPVLSQKALEPTAQFISGHVQETDKDIVNANADGEDEDVDFDDFEAFESIMG